MLIAELDVNAAMNAMPSQVDTLIALIKRMKHAFEVPQLLHDPGLTAAMRIAQLNFNAVVKNAFLRLRLCCSEKKQIKVSAATWLRGTCRSIVEVRFVYPCQLLRFVFWLCGGARGHGSFR
eukprot:4230748-Pleurochrysis_carterae.AAC.1